LREALGPHDVGHSGVFTGREVLSLRSLFQRVFEHSLKEVRNNLIIM